MTLSQDSCLSFLSNHPIKQLIVPSFFSLSLCFSVPNCSTSCRGFHLAIQKVCNLAHSRTVASTVAEYGLHSGFAARLRTLSALLPKSRNGGLLVSPNPQRSWASTVTAVPWALPPSGSGDAVGAWVGEVTSSPASTPATGSLLVEAGLNAASRAAKGRATCRYESEDAPNP